MKALLLSIIALIILQSVSFGQNRCVLKYASLEKLLTDSETDSLLKLERECAIEFHQIINDYRKGSGSDELIWSDALWLAARNHTDYLIMNNLFAHKEIEGKALFTGKEPTDRVQFVLGEKHYSGENIAQTWTNNRSARYMAEDAFELWRNSTGHNKNMLNKSYQAHGVAFRINPENGMLIATNVFSLSVPFKSIQNLASQLMISESNYTYDYPKPRKKAESALSTGAIRKDIGNAFYYAKVQEQFNEAGKRNAELAKKTAKRNSEFLSSFVKNRELIKEMKGQSWFTHTESKAVAGNVFQHISGKHKNVITSVIVAFKPEKYSISELSKCVYDAWKANLIESASKYACHVALKRKGEHFIVCASFEQAG
jgi:uncharacterized protein YkwD